MYNPIIAERIARLQEKLRELNFHAAMIYDRENLIYFAGIDDLEGGALAVPAEGEPELFCIWLEYEKVCAKCGIEKVTAFRFPDNNQSTMMGAWLKNQGWTAPRIAFTRYFISLKDFQCLQAAAPDMQVCDMATLAYQLRSVKTPDEIEKMRVAARAVSAGMKAAFEAARPGVAETDVLAEAEYAMAKAGSMGSSFRMQVLTKSRQMECHPYASHAIIEDNGPVVIHLGASSEGYVAKMCRTVFLGNPAPESVKLYETLVACQKATAEYIRPGVTCAQAFDFSAAFMAEQGFSRGWVMDHIGYGVGIRQSEFYPIVAKGNPTVLEENMVIDLLLPTIYGRFGGPRITDTILIGENGPEYLTDFTTETVIK